MTARLESMGRGAMRTRPVSEDDFRIASSPKIDAAISPFIMFAADALDGSLTPQFGVAGCRYETTNGDCL
ncbi:MAG: hypothetical protein V4475_05820 [Pseudomonadota bacterium]